ncbi:MAG: hypothetical protein RBR98_02255, partial [Candidatus Moranbacteria bacterium]|nr:hypothetical protein [Candidatus Moranbacteria bacterium]
LILKALRLMVRFCNKARNTAWSVAGGRFIGIGFPGGVLLFLEPIFRPKRGPYFQRMRGRF